MFAYLVKRVISGVLVLTLVSMAIFLLFWFGPTSPARTICDNETEQPVHPRAPARPTSARSVTTTPSTRSTASSSRASSRAARSWSSSQRVRVRRALPRHLVQHQAAGQGGAGHATSRDLLRRHRRRLPLPLFGMPIGVAAARRRGTLSRQGTGLQLPGHQLRPLLPVRPADLALSHGHLRDPAVQRHAATSRRSPTDHGSGSAECCWPWLALGIFGCTQYTRFTRGAMVEALSEDYIRTAKAKGLTPRTVVYRHGLRAALVPVVTIFGIDFAHPARRHDLHRAHLRDPGHRLLGL